MGPFLAESRTGIPADTTSHGPFDVEYLGQVGGEPGRRLLAGAACLLNPIARPEPSPWS
jgi:hypothetical protein